MFLQSFHTFNTGLPRVSPHCCSKQTCLLAVSMTIFVCVYFLYTYIPNQEVIVGRNNSQCSDLQVNENCSGRGYVIAMNLWEQLTMGASNLIDLQCWAARHRLTVVEPLINRSQYVFTFNDSLTKNLLQFGDMYDREEWSRFSKHKHLLPMVARGEFMQEISRFNKDVILVEIVSRETPCTFKWPEGSGDIEQIHHLKILRSVCVQLHYDRVEDFDRAIFGGLLPHNSLVIFSEWKGMAYHNRLNIHLQCEARSYACRSTPSKRLLNDTENYAQRYLGGLENYNALMVRFEPSQMDRAKHREYIMNMIDTALHNWNKMVAKTSNPATFLAFDYGSFGSETFRTINYGGLSEQLEAFHQTIYNHSISFQDWEDTFRTVAGSSPSGYIALLQLQLVARAKCVTIIGHRSHFLEYASQTYSRYHPTGACKEIVGLRTSSVC